MSQDREFEKYLEGKTDLSKLYAELPPVDFPKHLDAAILAEAHRAVNARPGARPRRNWSIPLGMVATLFLAVMIALQLPYMLKDAAQPQQLKEERMAALMDKSTVEAASPAPDEGKLSQLTGRLLAKSKSDSNRGEPAPVSAEAEAPAKANAPQLAAPQESTAVESNQSGATSVPASPPVAAPSPSAAPAPARAAKRMELRERAELDTVEAFSKEKKASGHAEAGASDSMEQRAPAAARMAAPQPAQAERSMNQSTKDEASAASLRPEEWLKRIKQLKQEGKLAEARKDLAAFKKRYPDYPVPEMLEVR